MKVMCVLKVKVKFRLSFCLCSRWQGLCSTGLAATGGLEAGEGHLLPSAKVIFCHHDDDDDLYIIGAVCLSVTKVIILPNGTF